MPYKDKEKKREYDREYRIKHKDEPKTIAQRRKRSANYRTKHKEKERIRHVVYRATHKKEEKAYREKRK